MIIPYMNFPMPMAPAAAFDPTTVPPLPELTQPPPVGRVRLNGWGVIAADGVDAAVFLQGQLSNDVALQQPSQARLAAYCSPKGRMQASMVIIKRAPDAFWLATPLDGLAALLKRLRMFVLRAKVVLSDATDSVPVWGQIDAGAPTAEPWAASADAQGVWTVALYPAAGRARSMLLGAAQAHGTLTEAAWARSEVAAGVVPVGAGLADALVPQMLNYESVGGVNFKKGCYPGQEVVARSQYRGTLKRRALPAVVDAPATVGQEVFGAADAEQACGVVAYAAPLDGAEPQGRWVAMVSLQVSAIGHALTLGSATGPAVRLSALPYALLSDL
jgi:tRNA-modifying protein YgfZ